MQAKRAGTITPEQQARMEQLHTQARQKAEMVKLQIQGVLTPEQRQQIETKKQEMRQRMEQRHREASGVGPPGTAEHHTEEADR